MEAQFVIIKNYNKLLSRQNCIFCSSDVYNHYGGSPTSNLYVSYRNIPFLVKVCSEDDIHIDPTNTGSIPVICNSKIRSAWGFGQSPTPFSAKIYKSSNFSPATEVLFQITPIKMFEEDKIIISTEEARNRDCFYKAVKEQTIDCPAPVGNEFVINFNGKIWVLLVKSYKIAGINTFISESGSVDLSTFGVSSLNDPNKMSNDDFTNEVRLEILSQGNTIDMMSGNSSRGRQTSINEMIDYAYLINKNTHFLFMLPASTKETKMLISKLELDGDNVYEANSGFNNIFQRSFTSENLGIGGLNQEFLDIFRRAFASRVFSPTLVKKFGIKHARGMLLYGPPGTGKTLIARQLANILNCDEPKKISGPEVLSKFVGEAEQNVRELFKEAEAEWSEKGSNSKLHLIIIDEIDAITKQRGKSSDSVASYDSIVNQLLAKMDGVDSPDNFLVIGMTNRKDMIDSALLRPGRFEIQVEIPLPDKEGRLQIFRIHTKKLRESQPPALAEDVSLEELAELTKNYSGAEIQGVVNNATSSAMNRMVNFESMILSEDDRKKLASNSNTSSTTSISSTNVKPSADLNKEFVVTRGDFMMALEQVKPGYGNTGDELQNMDPLGFLKSVKSTNEVFDSIQLYIETMRQSPVINISSALVYTNGSFGACGSGKSALAAAIARSSGIEYIRVISASNLLHKVSTEYGWNQTIFDIFDDAKKVPEALIILDGLEGIVQFSKVGMRFSSTIFQTICGFLRDAPKNGRKIMILATCDSYSYMKEIGIAQKFERKFAINSMSGEETLEAVIEYAESYFPKSVTLEKSFYEAKQKIETARSKFRKDGDEIEIVAGTRDAIADEYLPDYLKMHEDNNELFINPVLKALEFCKTVAMSVMKKQYGDDWEVNETTFVAQATFERVLTNYLQN